MPLVLGCLLNGTPFHAVSPWHDEATFKHLFCITRPRLIFCDGVVYERLGVVAKMLKTPVYTLKDHKNGLYAFGIWLYGNGNNGFYEL